jgi:hypothetical protein
MHALATLILAVGSQSTPAAAKPVAANTPPPLVLSGVWRGREVAGSVGVRYPTLTFGDTRSSLAYEDSSGLSGGMSVKVESIVVRGTDVRFAVKGAQPRYYRGVWDGQAVKGTFSAEASGGPALGTFELAPMVYDDSPRLPFTMIARRKTQPAQPSGRANLGRVVFDRDDDQDSEQRAYMRLVGYRLAGVSGGAQVLEAMMDRYGSECTGQSQGLSVYGPPTGSLGDCDRLVSDMARVAATVDKAITQAEDDARRAQILPGRMRELRSQLDVDEGDWDRAVGRLRTIQTEREKN